jgi:hypothetical protein
VKASFSAKSVSNKKAAFFYHPRTPDKAGERHLASFSDTAGIPFYTF